MSLVPLSVLDLSPIVQGGSASQSFRNTLDLAQHAEQWGYKRFWVAEHHNIPSVASAATSVVIAHVAAGTRTIRVGAGGIMLPNHSPLVIAEQFGTLESLFPGRIDLGLGRAPGSDQTTARAMRRAPQAAEAFPQDVVELMAYFRGEAGGVRAVPGDHLDVPVFILGSSLFGAQLAAHLGLPFAFASHFAPLMLDQAAEIYRARFQPSDRLAKPYFIVGANVVAAHSDEEARRLFTSYEQSFINLSRGRPMPVPPPVDAIDWSTLSPIERSQLEPMFSTAIVGSPSTVHSRLDALISRTQADEVIVATQIYEHSARLRSYQLAIQR